MYRKILVPLDGSRFAEAALALALELSRRAEAPVHLVTVAEQPPEFTGEEADASTEWAEEYLAEARKATASRAGGTVTTAVRAGPVVDRLRDEAEESGCDVVVMATHGRGVLSRAWLGSVADAFVRRSSHPVLMVRPEEADARRRGWEGKETPAPARILVPLDGSAPSEQALEHAMELADLFGAGLDLIRVVDKPLGESRPYLPHVDVRSGEEARRLALEYLEERAGQLRRRGLSVNTRVAVASQPGHAIAEAVESGGADMVAMSTRGQTGMKRTLLGSTADKVVRGTSVPVLLHRGAAE